MNTGKLVLGPHLKTLPVLLQTITGVCEPIVDMPAEVPVYYREKSAARAKKAAPAR